VPHTSEEHPSLSAAKFETGARETIKYVAAVFSEGGNVGLTSSNVALDAELISHQAAPRICQSDTVAQEQQDELEALLAIYEDAIDMRGKPPSKKGDQCGGFAVALKCHPDSDEILDSTIKLVVLFQGSYPEVKGGLLCTIEHSLPSTVFSPDMSNALLEVVRDELTNFDDGEQCACALISAAEGWTQDHPFVKSSEEAATATACAATVEEASDATAIFAEGEDTTAEALASEEEVIMKWYTVGVDDEVDQELATEATLDACQFMASARSGGGRAAVPAAVVRPAALQTREKIRKLVVGLVGKPSAGKSTFFNCVTRLQTEAKVGAHPFTTIEPNFGTGWWASNDPHDICDGRNKVEEGGHAAARYGRDGKGRRLLPLLIKDVAGLIPGAYKGHGKGNRFLNDLCDADVLIHVVDCSGTSDSRGNLVGAGDSGASSAEADVKWVRDELHQWIFGNVLNKWHSVVRAAKASEKAAEDRVVALFSGYHTPKNAVVIAATRAGLNPKHPHLWDRQQLHLMVAHFLSVRFPMCLALNKIDKLLTTTSATTQPTTLNGTAASALSGVPRPPFNFATTKIEEARAMATTHGYVAVPCSAKLETQLIRLASLGEIQYEIGAPTLAVTSSPPASGCDGHAQPPHPAKIIKDKNQIVHGARKIMDMYGSTGVLDAVSTAVGLRDPILVYPVSDIRKGLPLGAPNADSKYLDCLCALPGSTIEDLYEALKRGAVEGVRVEGDFILAEAAPLVTSRNTDLASTLAPHTKQLGKDAELSTAVAVVKVMTNRKASWQKNLK
jgi:ribosome-binding ATPase YchF (GTP1/OBG family)